jgi:hypothetical protein
MTTGERVQVDIILLALEDSLREIEREELLIWNQRRREVLPNE